MAESQWAPVRALTRPKQPRVVKLGNPEPGPGVAQHLATSAAQVHGDYLECEHWAPAGAFAPGPQRLGQGGGGGDLQEGARHLPANYRPISLLEAAYKVFARIMASRLQRALGPSVRQAQYGFTRRRSTLDAVMLIRRDIELIEERPRSPCVWSSSIGRRPATR
eukprot:12406174-Alexandrium_andersonii.AAC.1